MATASQKMIEIKFFVLILGAFTPAPTMLTPVVWIPLKENVSFFDFWELGSYPAAPTTDSATAKPIPVAAHMWGDTFSKNLDTN